MDDTAFFYSRTLRIIVALAIIIPLVGIGALVWHFVSDVPDTATQDEDLPDTDDIVDDVSEEVEEEPPSGGNPLKPIGPPASSRVISGS